MGPVVAIFKSTSKPGRMYEIRQGGDGIFYCSCWQWKINKTCKHVNSYISNQSQTPPPLDKPPVERNEPNEIQMAIDEAVNMMKGG